MTTTVWNKQPMSTHGNLDTSPNHGFKGPDTQEYTVSLHWCGEQKTRKSNLGVRSQDRGYIWWGEWPGQGTTEASGEPGQRFSKYGQGTPEILQKVCEIL